MPNIKPIVFKSIGYNDNLIIESGALDFNEFNLGCISEKYTLIGFDIFTENQQQLTEPIAVNYIDPNGNEKIFRKSPRIDSYQLSDAINCIDIPDIPCDGLNRFEYTILPNADALITFKLDKRNTLTQQLKQQIGTAEDQNTAVLEDLFDGYDAKNILPNNLTEQDKIKDVSQTEINGENFYLKQIVNIKVISSNGYSNATGVETKPQQKSVLKKLLPFIAIVGICVVAFKVISSINNED